VRTNTRKLDHLVQSRLQIELLGFGTRVTLSPQETVRQQKLRRRTEIKDHVSDSAELTTDLR
jgi:hypothetical protein